MQSELNYTKWEHYVPRIYYKGFSEIKKKKSKEKLLIWALNTKTLQQIDRKVDICNFCAENDLYELKDKDGGYIARNTIEKAFGRIEAKVGTVITAIIAKSQNKNCLRCSNILSEYDKSILIILMTMLLFRDPNTIDYGVKIFQKLNPDMDAREARNQTLLNLLPFGIEPEWDENTIIRSAVEKYAGMEFQIGITSNDVIITSDRPIIEWPPNEKDLFNRPQAVVFPLTSRLVLYMFPIETNQQIGRSFFFELSEEQIKDIQFNVAVSSMAWIFSKEALTDEQLERIREGRSRWESKSGTNVD